MQTFNWAIEDIITAHPNLYLEHCAVMAVALMSQFSAMPCEFVVECENFNPDSLGDEMRFLAKVSWEDHTAQKAKRILQTEQGKSIAERAAIALAALLYAKLIPEGQMRVTKEGDRADYWLPSLKCALEVSGTQKPRELSRRHRTKIAQVISNPLHWDGYVVVCCFSKRRRIIRWSYHKTT
jgi:hypothetical protein